MSKQAYHEPKFDDSSAVGWDMHLRISGLEPFGDHFILRVVCERVVDWDAIRLAIFGNRQTEDEDNELIERISRLIFKHDLTRLLADRIKPL